MSVSFRFLHDHAGAMAYLLADTKAGEAVLIDPRSADVPDLRAWLADRQWRLRWVLRTHEHDALQIRESSALAALGAPVIEHRAPTGDAARVGFGGEFVQVLATPGHTAGCLSFAWRDRVFCGGLMAADTCPFQPRPAQPERMWDSVQQHIFSRPDETLLFSGHSRTARVVSTVLDQRLNHPWFAQASREEFLARCRAAALVSTWRRNGDGLHFQH
jgi:glyoxylase-like metal-dependent hydrolase (beta-lactamase superfamily II)